LQTALIIVSATSGKVQKPAGKVGMSKEEYPHITYDLTLAARKGASENALIRLFK
jgi:hypothetical protein